MQPVLKREQVPGGGTDVITYTNSHITIAILQKAFYYTESRS
jgi:hypothetical protein